MPIKLRKNYIIPQITYAGICELNTKKTHPCQFGNLEILTVNERVKTCIVHHSTIKEEKEEEDKEDDLKEEVIDIVYSDGDFSEDDNFDLQDPSTDPVAEENLLDLVVLKPEDSVEDDNEIAVPDLQIDIIDDVEELKKPEESVEVEQINEVKSKQLTKKEPPKKQKRRTRQSKKRNTRRKKRSDTDLDSDASEEILSKLKSKKTSVFAPDTDRSYRFNKPRSKLKNLAFLDSGFWKKSSLNDEEALKSFEAKAQDRKYLNAAFKCTDCYKGFSQKSMLDRHIPQRHSEVSS